MTFEEYLARYRLLQHALERDEQSLRLMEKSAYRSFSERFAAASSPTLRALAASKESLRARAAHRRRLCERYALRLARAVALIPAGELREYARYRFLYGLTHEEVAEVSFYSVRTVYRFAKNARLEMEKAMRAVSPKARRTPPARYLVRGTLRRKDYRVGRESRSVAALTARRKSAPFRPIIARG